MVAVAMLGTGNQVAAGPDADLGCVDGLTTLQKKMGHEAVERFGIDLAVAQTRTVTAPTAVGGSQAQVDERGGSISSQDGVDQLEQGVGACSRGVRCVRLPQWRGLRSCSYWRYCATTKQCPPTDYASKPTYS